MANKSYRCQCKNSTNQKTCLNKSRNIFTFNKKRYCFIHANRYFAKYANTIKAGFIGYKVRKKLQNIYYKLPDELQCKIAYYMNEEFYNSKQLKIMRIIVNNKLSEFITKHNLGFKNIDWSNWHLFTNLHDNYTHITNTHNTIVYNFRIFSKYRILVDFDVYDSFTRLHTWLKKNIDSIIHNKIELSNNKNTNKINAANLDILYNITDYHINNDTGDSSSC